MKSTVLSLAPLPAELVKALIMQTPDLPDFDVVYGHEMGSQELAQAFSRVDAVMGDYSFKQKITPDVLAQVRTLRLIQQPSVGYQHIDIEACTARRIPVANTPGANTVSVAEHTIACALILLRNMLTAHQSMREGRWDQMSIRPAELAGKTWGIVGFGRTGRAVCMRLRPFALGRIVYYDIVRAAPEVEEEYGAAYSGLRELLSASDVVSLHAPLTGSTVRMIGGDELKTMKPTAYFINVARGELVDEGALAWALREKWIAGAAVDVFSEEPVPAGNPLLGAAGNNLLLTPHVAGVSSEAAGRIINMAAGNIARVLKGLEPLYLVNSLPEGGEG